MREFSSWLKCLFHLFCEEVFWVLGAWQLLMKTTHSGTSVLRAGVFQSFLCFPVSYSYHQGLGLEKSVQVSACF